MTSDPAADRDERAGDGGGWRGDVRVGVHAWTGGGPPPDIDAEGPEAVPESVARTILLDALTGQARSRKELRQRLAKKGVPDEIAERLLDRFAEVGLVNDEAFARSWVESRQRSRGLARRALAQELRRKGVDDETAQTALDDVDPAQEEQAARMLVRKKLRSLQGVDQAAATRRLAGLLARKGYPAGLAFRVVREELGASDEDDPSDMMGP